MKNTTKKEAYISKKGHYHFWYCEVHNTSHGAIKYYECKTQKKEECKCGISRTFLSGKEKGKCLDCGRYASVNKEEWRGEAIDVVMNMLANPSYECNEAGSYKVDLLLDWISQKKKEWENKKPFNKEQFMKDAREVRKTFESEINYASASKCPIHQCKNCGVVWAKKK